MVQSTKMHLDEMAILPNFAIDSNKISIVERQDSKSIEKAQKISQSHLVSQEISNSSLEGRISLDPVQLGYPAIDPGHLQAVEKELVRLQTNPEPEEVNFLTKVRVVIAEILAQLNEISQSDRTQTERMKSEFRRASNEASKYTVQMGNMGLWIAGAGLGFLLASQFAVQNQAGREVLKFVSDQSPHIGGMFTSRYQASQKEADALAQLMLAEYNAKTSKSQSESSSKQEVINLLDKVLESMKRAASAS